jgi:hypothetical protein
MKRPAAAAMPTWVRQRPPDRGGLALLLRMELHFLRLHLLYSACDSVKRKSIGYGQGQLSVVLDLSVEFEAFVAQDSTSDRHWPTPFGIE